VSIKDKGRIREVLQNWPRIDEARISVVTDGEQHQNERLAMPISSETQDRVSSALVILV
jgi:hypothetical protein